MKEEEEKLQKLYLEFQMLDQSIKQLEKQSAALNNQLMDLMVTKHALEEMKNIGQGTEILTPLSSGIYIKTQLKDNENFIVNVGSNVTTVKDLQSTKKLIENQIDEIEKLQQNLATQMQTQTNKVSSLEQEINKIISLVQNNNNKNK